jgi:uncharacterized membrane protein YphA (DoxX/SURF4 family)
MPDKHRNSNMPSLLLRLGLAFVFLYAAISSLREPLVWAAYLPGFLTQSISATLLIKIFAIYELGLVAWLLIGRLTKYAALLCAITLAGIVAANTSQLATTFRDVGLIFMAATLFFVEKQ